MSIFKRGKTWWYKFHFDGLPIRESAKTHSKTLAKQAEKNRRRDLEQGFNGISDDRSSRVRSVEQVALDYLREYRAPPPIDGICGLRCRKCGPTPREQDAD